MTAFTDGLKTLSRKQPVVLVLDTCELLGGSGPWLREVMSRSGRRVVWVIGTRLESDLVAAGDSESIRYEREVDEQRLRTITLRRFDDRTAAEYLQQRLGSLPPELDLDRVIALTQGVPLALHIMSKMIADQVRTGRPLEQLYDEVAPDGTVSTVVARMAERYLHHATYDPDSDLHRDLPALHGLALVNVEQNPTRPSAFPPDLFDSPWAPRREDTVVAIDRDPAMLAALWGIEAGDVAARLRELGRHHDFVHSGDGTLHRDVRDAIRTFLLVPKHRATVTDINTRAVDHLRQQLAGHQHSSIEAQLTDTAWRTTTAALLWHTCWINPSDGIPVLRHLYAPARVLQPSYARLLIGITTYFMPYLTESDQNLLTQLMDLSSPVPRRASARAAIHALTAAPSPEPPLLHGDSRPLLHLLRAEIARALGLDLADQVSCFRRAARVFTPGSGPTAMKIGQLALSCTLADPETQPVRLQKALVEARRIAVRYRPDDVVAHLNFGYLLYDLGRFAEAEGVYRTAVRIDPDYAVAYNGLGNVLHALGRFAEAEDAYREAIRIDPDYAFAHNGLGNLLYDLGRFTETEDAYREAIRIDPDYAFAHNGLGNVLYGLGRFTEAEDAYREAIRADPYYAFAHNGLGIMLKEQGRYTEAERAHRRAIESDPGYAIAHGWLGLLLMCVGEFERARLELEQADARPRSELSRWILDRAHPPSGASVHTPDSVHAAFDEPLPPRTVLPSTFTMAEIRALATAGKGDGPRAVEILRSVVDQRRPSDRFVRPLYDLLARPEPIAGLEQLLDVWREIIAADPSAVGPWGGPNPA
ncbi:tetratricopeptide repeat protein [Nonomuraea ferruginea]|uniref:tetratricopeptide repeat protein n=1 Tax=Nonomuraea ferruginea TaxID=46174 RepID=UPI00361D8123